MIDTILSRRVTALFLSILAMCSLAEAVAPADIVHSVYSADQHFPEFLPLWHEGWSLKDIDGKPLVVAREGMPLGGYIHVYVRNTGNQTLTIKDVRLEGASLTGAIQFSKDEKAGIHPASVRIAKIPQEQIDRLIQLGEPVWWKVDPDHIKPGGFADVTIRMRRNPPAKLVNVEVVCEEDVLAARVEVGKAQSVLAGVNYAIDLSEAITYVRAPANRGTKLVKLSIDGLDVTSQSRFLADPQLDTTVILTKLSEPVGRGSFHYFQADFADGSRAAGNVRAIADEFRYGMWGYINKGDTPKERADYFLKDMEAHNINVLMYSISGDVQDFMTSSEGVTYSQRTGMRMMATWPGNTGQPVYYFLLDEPDAQDAAVSDLPPPFRLGSLAQGLVQKSKQIRARDPVPPILLNIDGTYKPENWYTYAQLPDVMCADPYYSGELESAIRKRPQSLNVMNKPTYVYAVSTICRSACSPRPLHIILNCVRSDNKQNPFRFSTPIEKRIEVYYALAGGATSLSYWWYTPYDECYGVGGDDPKGHALWKEMGLLGAEVRTASEVLTCGCPASLNVTASPNLWTRTLLSGSNTVVLLVVNDTTVSGKNGTTIKAVSPADVTVHLPAWLKCSSVFEVESGGTRDVRSTIAGSQVTVNLDQAKVARMIILTADADLRGRLQALYKKRFAPVVARLKQMH